MRIYRWFSGLALYLTILAFAGGASFIFYENSDSPWVVLMAYVFVFYSPATIAVLRGNSSEASFSADNLVKGLAAAAVMGVVHLLVWIEKGDLFLLAFVVGMDIIVMLLTSNIPSSDQRSTAG